MNFKEQITDLKLEILKAIKRETQNNEPYQHVCQTPDNCYVNTFTPDGKKTDFRELVGINLENYKIDFYLESIDDYYSEDAFSDNIPVELLNYIYNYLIDFNEKSKKYETI